MSIPSRTRATVRRKARDVARVAIIGAGRGGTALMEIFTKDPLVKIVGLAEVRPKAPGLKLAHQLGIPVVREYRQLLNMTGTDLIIDVSGNPEVEQELRNAPRTGLNVIGGSSAKFMWQLIEARIRASAEIEKALNRYQALYKLYVNEAATAVTEERTRIACEIHDGLVQTLSGVNFKLDLCQEMIRKDPCQSQALLREIRTQLKVAIQEARQVIFNLRPLHYEQLDLVPALTNYLKSYETQSHIKTQFSVTGTETNLAPRIKIFLFRILQEALSNVEKHARATEVMVELCIARQVLKTMITDNGVGFDIQAVSRDPEKWDHFGLRGMQERAKLAGGQVKIESTKGKGTRVVIQVPLTKKETGRNGTH